MVHSPLFPIKKILPRSECFVFTYIQLWLSKYPCIEQSLFAFQSRSCIIDQHTRASPYTELICVFYSICLRSVSIICLWGVRAFSGQVLYLVCAYCHLNIAYAQWMCMCNWFKLKRRQLLRVLCLLDGKGWSDARALNCIHRSTPEPHSPTNSIRTHIISNCCHIYHMVVHQLSHVVLQTRALGAITNRHTCLLVLAGYLLWFYWSASRLLVSERSFRVFVMSYTLFVERRDAIKGLQTKSQSGLSWYIK